MFNVDVRKEAQENLEYEVDKYNESVKKAKNVAKKLYDSRVAYHERLSLAIDYINSLKNTPDDFGLDLNETIDQYNKFIDVRETISSSSFKDNSYLLAMVVGPSVLSDIGFERGWDEDVITASNILEFLGMGFLLGGGPIGWAVAGVTAAYRSEKNRQEAERINDEALSLREDRKKQEAFRRELLRAKRMVDTDSLGIKWMMDAFKSYPKNFEDLTLDQIKRLGAFVNCVRAGAYNMNKKLDRHGTFRMDKVDWKACGINPAGY